MGCCEIKGSYDNFDLQYKRPPIENQNRIQNRDVIRIGTRPDSDLKVFKKNLDHFDIPKTKEVKIPTAEIPYDIIKNKKRLNLTIFESHCLTEGTVLKINPGGLEGSERMAKDGLTIFGSKNEECINDFNFPDEEIIGKRHFEIKYDLHKDNYKIKNLFGSGLFIKINKKLLLRNNSIFSFSTSHIITQIAIDPKFSDEVTTVSEGEFNSVITLKVIHGINKNQEYSFCSKEKNKILIGRLQIGGIDISFAEESTSRLQCTVFYENNNWYIVDGSGFRASLNGTWYLADEYMDIYEGMIFRAGTTSFQAHIYDS